MVIRPKQPLENDASDENRFVPNDENQYGTIVILRRRLLQGHLREFWGMETTMIMITLPSCHRHRADPT